MTPEFSNGPASGNWSLCSPIPCKPSVLTWPKVILCIFLDLSLKKWAASVSILYFLRCSPLCSPHCEKAKQSLGAATGRYFPPQPCQVPANSQKVIVILDLFTSLSSSLLLLWLVLFKSWRLCPCRNGQSVGMLKVPEKNKLPLPIALTLVFREEKALSFFNQWQFKYFLKLI